ncbi:hypothetical protein K1719_028725 [Acacia pycnantha]|nr:hypothetical protein K1719_041224 [Acacia pycnantha]KAI9090390.1 hypothetical protein K1719_028725 [Acacia pycnantha]
MGSGPKSLRSFHIHGKKHEFRDVPKGCLAIKLLKEAEEEFGFDQKGTITIPCHIEEFRSVQDMIDREWSRHHHHAHGGCFGF